jgi:hypothetical protein
MNKFAYILLAVLLPALILAFARSIGVGGSSQPGTKGY